MGRLNDLYKKKDGAKLFKVWARIGVLPYVIGQIMLLGTSNKALELLRNGVEIKIKNKLRKKYTYALDDFDKLYHSHSTFGETSRRVWICWLQGIDVAPLIVQRCYKSMSDNIKDREIVLITAKNRKDYIVFPDYIEKKYEDGVITHTHFSDILRVGLLAKYGGTWVDATVFCTGGNIPRYMLDGDFFVFQNLKPGADGKVLNMSSWFMTSQIGNKLVLAVQALLFAYWEKEEYLVDYFLLHHFFMIVADRYRDNWKNIPQYPNSLPHVLLLNLFEPYNQEKYEELKRICPFHKLAYKRTEEEFARKGTYYDVIFN